MKPLKQLFLLSLMMTATPSLADEQFVINELMQSNIDCVMDDLNEFPDSWVELYNASTTTLQLSNYRLGVKSKADKAWHLPAKEVKPGEYVLVYCDKTGKGMHTDFRLESGKGCEVYLFKDGETIDKVTSLKKQPAPNIAYGRETDGSDSWGYQLTPTPLEANCGSVCQADHILGEPVFSEKGRVLTLAATLSLTLTVPEGTPEGTSIHYTTDGTEPTTSSPLYINTLTVNTSKTIRAKLFCNGWLSPRSTVQSYIFLGRDMTIPVISIVTSNSYLNDAKIGIFANNTNKNNKKDWRRPINFELFVNPGEESVLNQLCETRVMGGQSREWKRKSMAIYANKRFGVKRLAYEFFPDQKPGLTDFKSIMLRNAGNDFDGLYMRDAIIQRSMAINVDLDWQAWRPAVVFINGAYHCMLNIRERSNDDNIFTNYDGLEDIDMMEITSDNNKLVAELKAGTADNYDKFVTFYSESGHTLAEFEQWMDCEEFINLMVMNLFYNNQDFPGNNLVLWRPTADGGKWRWITKDTDFGLGLYGSQASYNTIQWIYNPNFDSGRAWANFSEATLLFRHLMDDKDFNREFIDRCAVYMGDFLSEKRVREVWDEMLTLAKPEIVKHKDVVRPDWAWWGYNPEQSLNDEINKARTWLRNRHASFYSQLANYYKLGNPASLTISQETGDDTKAAISFNGIQLSRGTFDGKFFSGRQMSLKGTDEEGGPRITGWTVKTVANGKTEQQTYAGAELTLTMPQATTVAITAHTGDFTGIETLKQAIPTGDVYDINGRKVRPASTTLDGLPKGIYIINGKKVVK